MDEVRRPDDDELCGFVALGDRGWQACTVFGAELGRHAQRDDAVAHVLREGLAALAERWTLRNGETGAEEVVCIQEAHAGSVTVALGYYSVPGVPTMTITVDDLAAGAWSLTR